MYQQVDKPFPVLNMARELRDALYDAFIEPSIPFRVQTYGLSIAAEDQIPPVLLRISKQFSAECRDHIGSTTTTPTAKLAIRDRGLEHTDSLPDEVIEWAQSFERLDLHLFTAARNKGRDLKANVLWVEDLLGKISNKDVHIKVYMQRREGQATQSFPKLFKSKTTRPILERLISLGQVTTFEVYSTNPAVQSCVGIDSTIGDATEMIGLWEQDGGFQRV